MHSKLPDESRFFKVFFPFFIILILVICTWGLLSLSSCNSMPDLFKTADDVFDDAIKITVDKSAIQRDTDVSVTVEVVNKETSAINENKD